MPGAQRTKVFYVEGRFAHERLEDHEVDSKAEAERLVATGAFALSQKEANEQANTTPPATPIDEPAEPAAPATEESAG